MSSMQPSESRVPINLKWGKTVFSSKISIQPGSDAKLLKRQVQALTNVPPSRQKLLCPSKCWKGALKDTDRIPLDIVVPKGKDAVPVTLIGSAEVLVEKPPEERPRFVEDMSTEAVREAKRMAAATSAASATGGGNDELEEQAAEEVGDIIALQRSPEDRYDGKMEMYQYNRFVTGLPQRQIESKLQTRRERSSSGDVSSTLVGEVAMTMGPELRRAYVNSLAVLNDGTLVSGLDDGHVQMWRRGELMKDIVHKGNNDGGVDQVVPFRASGVDGPAFATGGRGSVQIWTDDGNSVVGFSAPSGTSPASLATGSIRGNERIGGVEFLASCFKVTRNTNHNQFRLVPQDEAGRRRREAAELQERAIRDSLARTSQCVQVWFYNYSNNDSGAVGFGSLTIPPNSDESMVAVTKVTVSNEKLVCGDEIGCLRVFKFELESTLDTFAYQQFAYLQFQSSGFDCSISCMEPTEDNLLVVATDAKRSSTHQGTRLVSSATPLYVRNSRAVFIVDIERSAVLIVLDGHSDVVCCICPLPDGGILTGGGKMDATVQLWESNAIVRAQESQVPAQVGQVGNKEDVTILTKAQKLKEPGYVFDLKVLPDAEPGSRLFAVAGARYNVVKIVI